MVKEIILKARKLPVKPEHQYLVTKSEKEAYIKSIKSGRHFWHTEFTVIKNI